MNIVQILGITFVCVIMVCVGWTLIEYIFSRWGESPTNRNKKLLERANKLSHKKL